MLSWLLWQYFGTMSKNLLGCARAFTAITRLAAVGVLLALGALPASAWTIRGTVHTETPGAALVVHAWARGEALAARPELLDAPSVSAAATGGAPFSLDVGEAAPPVVVEVQASGHVGARFFVVLPEQASLPPVWLPVGQELRVRVSRGGTPVPGARVEGLVSKQAVREVELGRWSPALPSQHTDARGEVRGWVPVGASVTCTAIAPDGRWGRVSRLVQAGAPFEVKLDSRPLRVLVQDAAEEPVAGIELAPREAPLGSAAVTDANGAATVQVAPDADSEIVAWGQEVAGRALVRKGAVGPAVVTAQPRRALELSWRGPSRVLVLPSWLPAAIDRQRLRWLTGGSQHLPWLEPGGQVRLWAPGFVQTEVAVRSAAQPLAVTLTAGVNVQGLVLDVERRPLARIPVFAYVERYRSQAGLRLSANNLDRAALAWGVSDDHGRFSLPPLDPGPVWLIALHPGLPAVAFGPREAEPGANLVAMLVFERPSSLDVLVTNVAGEPLANVTVGVFPQMLDGRQWEARPPGHFFLKQEASASARTGEDGRASVGGLPTGKAWVLVHRAGFVPRVQEAEIPREGVDLGAQVLVRGVEVLGRVVDEAGKGLAEVEVTAWSRAGLGGGGETRTDGEGAFALSDQPAQDEINLHARLRGFLMLTPLLLKLPPEGEVVLRMRKAKVLTGRVVDADSQQRLADVSVWASEREGGRVGIGFDPTMTSRTDERGEFQIEGVHAGELELVASAQGYRRTVLPVTVPEDGVVPVVTVAIARGLELRGRVVDEGGQPVPGIRVSARAADWELLGATLPSSGHARTGPEGSFLIEGLGRGKHEVRGEAEDGGLARAVAEPGGAEVTLRLDRPGTVWGGVRAGQGRSPAGIKLRLSGSGSFWGEATSDEGGSFRFEKVPPGVLILTAEGPSATAGPQEVKVEAGRTTNVEVVLEATGTILGVVRGLTAAQIEGCVVFSVRARVQPDADGVFRLDGVPEGRELVSVSVNGQRLTKTVPVDVKAGETVSIEVEFGEGARLSGVVRWGAGEVAGLRVFAFWQGGDGQALTDAAGAFVIEGVAAGSVQVEVRARAGRLLLARTLQVEQDMAVELRVAEGGLRGQVLASRDRAPVAGAAVSVQPTESDRRHRQAVATDVAGRFAFSEIESGSYLVRASADGYASAERTVALGEGLTDVELTLEPEQGVELVLRRVSGPPPERVLLGLHREGIEQGMRLLVCDAHGRTTLRGLAPGVYEAMVIDRYYGRGAIQVPGPPVTITLREVGMLTVVVPPASSAGPWRVRAVDAATGQALPVFSSLGFGVRFGWTEVPGGETSVAGALGSVQVEALSPDGQTHSQLVQVAAGATVTVRFP